MDIKRLRISGEEMAAAMRANDLEDMAANARMEASVKDPEWLANFRKLRPDLADDPMFKDLPPEK